MDRTRLETKHASIGFPGAKALDGINFEMPIGETRAVVGVNGAGKSALMKMLAEANSTYSGGVLLNGKKAEVRAPVDIKKLGIQTVYQEVDMILHPTLSVVRNIVQSDMVMGKNGYIVDWKKVYKQGHEALGRLRIGRDQVDEYEPVQDLSLAQKQTMLIAKAIRSGCSFLIPDESTAPLGNTKTEELFRTVRHLYETENIAILFISHRLNEILEVYENYTVTRSGRVIDTTPVIGETATGEIVEKMLGRKFGESFLKEAYQIGEVLFRTENLSDAGGEIKSVPIQMKKSEMVGVAGLAGAGKSELCKTVSGAHKKTGGKVLLKNQELKITSPSEAVKSRMALVPEERRKEGVLVDKNVSSNLSAACLSRPYTGPFIRRRKVDDNTKRFIKDLGISTPSIKQWVRNLSGDNQQRVVVGKWPTVGCDVYMLDEPTKGVDVGARQDIFHLINETAEQGSCVVYTSCEGSELLSLVDRMYVVYNGTIMAELETAKTTEDEIMFYSVDGKNNKNGK